jgi:transposase
MNYVGIDIAKNFHIITIIKENGIKVFKKAFRVENDIVVYTAFIEKLETISVNFIIGIEATVIYGENLLEFFVIKGI